MDVPLGVALVDTDWGALEDGALDWAEGAFGLVDYTREGRRWQS